MDIGRIEKKICGFDVVSFDIFDTLLKRDVFKPIDVFELVQREYERRYNKASVFFEARIKAERIARESSKYPEVTLDEIYEKLELVDKEIYKNLELEIESQVLHCNYVIKPLFDRCVELGKDIYIISDMYLPKSFLETVLKREGYQKYKDLILSADYRKTKRSGELYKEYLKKYSVSSRKVIHIGDSWYADYVGTRRCGIQAFHISRMPKRTIYTEVPDDKADLDKRILFSFINTRVSNLKNRNEQLGYEILGPILYSFCCWIHDYYESIKEENRNYKRLWFAARDMYLFKKAYEIIYGDCDRLEYMYISRKSLRPILTVATNDITETGNAFPRGECSFEQIVKRMGYKLDDVDSTRVPLDIKLNPRELYKYPEIKKALSSETIMKQEKELAYAGEKYLRGCGFYDSDIVLADVGWHGTTQYILRRIMEASGNANNLYGLYLGCLDGTNDKIGKDNYQAFAFDEEHQSEFAKGILLFESLILAPHGSTQSYVINEDSVEPVLGHPDNISGFLNDVQNGAMRFVEDFKKSIISRNVQLDEKLCTKAFCKLTMYPQKDELITIGELDYDDFGIGKMAVPKPLGTYIFHPKQLYYDLKYSPWRIGFLYKLFKVRLPYAKLYGFVRKKQGKLT